MLAINKQLSTFIKSQNLICLCYIKDKRSHTSLSQSEVYATYIHGQF